MTGEPRGWQAARGCRRPGAVADFQLTDIYGRPFTRADLAGAPTLVFFGFTHCPDVCPTTLLKLARVKKAAGIANLRVLFVSIDPLRDTPQAVGTVRACLRSCICWTHR